MLNLPTKWKDRFDLGIKFALAARMKRGLMSKPILMEYLNHIFLWNGFNEPASEKSGFQSFLGTMESLVGLFKSTGIYSIQPIPVSSDGYVLNGIHRLAASMACGIQPNYIMTPDNKNVYNFLYFQKIETQRGRFSRLTLLKKLWRNLYVWRNFKVAIIFPKAFSIDQGNYAFKLLEKNASLLWDDAIAIGPYHLKYLLLNAYPDAAWLGIGQGMHGLERKVREVKDHSSTIQKIRIFIFYEDSNTQVSEIKTSIRRHYGIENSSIHISDDRADSISLARAYCSTSDGRLMFSGFNFDSDLFVRIKELRESLSIPQSQELASHLIAGSAALELFGGRTAKDIDLLGIPECAQHTKLFTHNDYSFQYGNNVVDLIDDVDVQYSLYGLNIARPELVIRQKFNRYEVKDERDINAYFSMFHR